MLSHSPSPTAIPLRRTLPRRIGCVSSALESTTIVSIGYEKRSIEDLIDLLADNAVELLVDVRLNPISRKKGFSKTALTLALADAGIEYRHERGLGNPKENREPFRQGLQSARDRYQEHLQNGAASVYQGVIDLASTSRIALLCYERDHDECHRSCILDAAQLGHPALSILRL